MNKRITNYKGVCRTAPATPGLVISTLTRKYIGTGIETSIGTGMGTGICREIRMGFLTGIGTEIKIWNDTGIATGIETWCGTNVSNPIDEDDIIGDAEQIQLTNMQASGAPSRRQGAPLAPTIVWLTP